MRSGFGARARQRGVITVFISMVLLILITSVVVTAFSLSTTNLRAVGNVQARDGAIAAAQWLIEQSIAGGAFAANPVAAVETDVPVDLNGDDAGDYLVDLAEPTCVRASIADAVTSSSVLLPGVSATAAWDTIWELTATAEDPATGARVTVMQAVRVLLSDAQKNTNCPT